MDKEDALFMKALKLLYEWRLEELGFTADITVTKMEDTEQ